MTRNISEDRTEIDLAYSLEAAARALMEVYSIAEPDQRVCVLLTPWTLILISALSINRHQRRSDSAYGVAGDRILSVVENFWKRVLPSDGISQKHGL